MLPDCPVHLCRQVTMALGAEGCPGGTTLSGPAFQPQGRCGEVNPGPAETGGSVQSWLLQLSHSWGHLKAAAGTAGPGLWPAIASSWF